MGKCYFHRTGFPQLCIVVHESRVQSIEWQQRRSQSSPIRSDRRGERHLMQQLRDDLEAYFDGQLRQFDWPLEFSQGTPFQRQVWQALQNIPYGETRSYQWLAQRIQRPNGVRAVGQANGANPFSIAIPCHRIIRADGSIGGYAGGLSLKKKLLELERRSMGEWVNG